ncbi:methylated-DNA--[protein]-cysteine S-methyltransferase [Desulfobulbus oligotrophicus]|jgi:methylated-DNA-[protein]-cysteine S-methyltransferase|uniref:Methylated-DNA--protein-cysteine methyltransferase n=1 Tax=Desulfobulbus oligotrophicus TaxID=1909699 RepID=A0A7T6APF4_9BACT|nr:methylated-DNA--[protein]-cysteine S-methyltransferase [Desulfobulbus oligotrophicus]MDY0391136.1 methylated-DNA--[protein]-cysteine S-methyltransferase [Desulfobulbus oligotrophicus]QQG64568.1 methylated-DNA--[protein]-cysteine S-methyltransferase [Desulfobulbus oligotrophicus]
MLYSTEHKTSLGTVTLVSDGDSLVGLWADGQKYFAATVQNKVLTPSDLPVFTLVKQWLDRYFAGEKPAISELPLSPRGSAFRTAVWDMLCAIPYGQVTTYGAIARAMAAKLHKERMSSQAVGGAVGHNPISIIIPCHRVVGSNGSLTGYAGGIDKKIQLLELEGVDTSQFFIPKKGTAL